MSSWIEEDIDTGDDLRIMRSTSVVWPVFFSVSFIFLSIAFVMRMKHNAIDFFLWYSAPVREFHRMKNQLFIDNERGEKTA